MDIRDAREDEIDEIVDVIQTAYAEYAPPPGDPLEAAWAAYTEERGDVRSRWTFAEHVVAVDAGRIAGAVTFFPEAWLPEIGDDGFPEGYASIRLLAVLPEFRGRKVGRLLTEECIRRARALGRPFVGLHTTERMHVARDMYERMGFTRFPERDIPIRPDLVIVAYRLALT